MSKLAAVSAADPTLASFIPLVWWIIIIKVLVIFLFLLLWQILMIWAERRIIGRMQNRPGPNRWGPFGLLQPVADALKLPLKEDIVPRQVDKLLFTLAPILSAAPALVSFAIIPIGPEVSIFGVHTPLQLTDLPVAVLLVLAMSSIGIYGIVLAGWASEGPYSLLGALRSSAQLISYEIAMGLSFVAVFLYAGTLSTTGIVNAQAHGWYVWELLPSFLIYVTTMVGETLQHEQVIKTVRAFVNAAHGNSAINSIQPGFYRIRTEIPAANAVARLVDPSNRVGRLVIPEGRQLDDTTDMKTNKVNPGIFSLISRATCVDLDGDRHCVKVDDLRAAATNSSPVSLAVPPWAIEPVNELGKDHRRIEGLIAPGTFNVDPSASAQSILANLISAGAEEYMKSGLVDTAQSMRLSPYHILVVSSLVQQEADSQDFPKVAQVIYNRLNAHHTLEFDSTVNYPRDRREVATSDADRAQRTPWNTYVSQGLPATAICSPGVDALRAAEHPEPGDWLYFVTIDTQGTTLFTRDYKQHLANIELAKRNGVLDSAR